MSTKSKRKEPFRYLFSSPAACSFEIIRINDNPVTAKPAEAAIIDISKSGCKLYTKLNLNASQNRIHVLVNLIIDEQPKQHRGTIRWQMQTDQSYYYGIQLELEESEKDQMLLDIRSLAVNKKIEVI